MLTTNPLSKKSVLAVPAHMELLGNIILQHFIDKKLSQKQNPSNFSKFQEGSISFFFNSQILAIFSRGLSKNFIFAVYLVL